MNKLFISFLFAIVDLTNNEIPRQTGLSFPMLREETLPRSSTVESCDAQV